MDLMSTEWSLLDVNQTLIMKFEWFHVMDYLKAFHLKEELELVSIMCSYIYTFSLTGYSKIMG